MALSYPLFATAAVLLLPAISFSAAVAQPYTETDRTAAGADPAVPLVVVDGEPVTAGDVEFMLLSRRVPPELREQARRPLLEQLVDHRLMRAYLAGRSAEAGAEELDEQVAAIHRLIRARGEDPEKLLARFGYSDQRLRRELSLPLAWKVHVNRMVTDERVREYWSTHRDQFDGTQVRASQILIRLPDDAGDEAVQQATQKLAGVREKIEAGTLTFADAARQHSEAPSREQGGDVGFFPYRGQMPVAFTKAVFPLKSGEIGPPFRTPFGLHLATVTDRKPGDLSLEDARPRVLAQLSQELWDEIVRELRAKAKIEWRDEK